MKKVIISIGIVLAVFGLWKYAPILIADKLRGYADQYIKLHSERRNSFFASNPLSNQDIVFLGDSITEGAQWEELFPQYRIKNRGISGDRTDDVLKRLEHITDGQPKAVFLKIGTNDFSRGSNDLRLIKDNYASIVDQIRSASPTTNLYLQSVLPRTVEYRSRIEELNLFIKTLAAKENCVFIDLYPVFLADDGAIEGATTNDQLHLNGPGYKRWANTIEPFIIKYKD